MRIVKFIITALTSATVIVVAYATEPMTYDAKGRVVLAARPGKVNNAVTGAYSYDNGNNRKQVQIN